MLISEVAVRPMLDTGVASDWDFRGSDTQYGTHGIHTYVAAMIPALARRLVDQYVPPRGVVLDPFCGGGSVIVEAIASGRQAVGRDVNDLAILISKAKTTRIEDEGAAKRVVERIVATVARKGHQPPLLEGNLAFWFKPEHTIALNALRHAIDTHIGLDNPLLPFIQVVFSATVRDVSLTYRNEVRLRRMTPEEIDRFNVDPVQRFRDRGLKAIEAATSLPGAATVDVAVGTAQSLDLDDDTCDAVICSPPYGDERNGVSYSQFSKNMLGWLGYSSDTIRESKALTLGWGNHSRVAPQSETLAVALEAINGYPDSVREAVAFYADYRNTLQEMARVTRGPIAIVIGQRVLRDTVFDNGAITTDLMRDLGVGLVDVFRRRLPSKRLPMMRKFGAAIDQETILVFQR